METEAVLGVISEEAEIGQEARLDYKPQGLSSSDRLSTTRPYLPTIAQPPPNRTTSCGPSVPTHKPEGGRGAFHMQTITEDKEPKGEGQLLAVPNVHSSC